MSSINEQQHKDTENTVGSIVANLSELDPSIPAHMICDHAVHRYEDTSYHSIHLEIDFEYTT